MAQFPVEVPDEVFTMPVDAPLDLSRWTGSGVPATVVLRWIDGQPFQAWSAALLAMIDPVELAEVDLPVYLRLLDRAESFEAARKATATFLLAGPKDTARDFNEVDRAPNELVVALRVPLGAAQSLVHHARRLHTHLPGTLALFRDGLITAKHVAKIVAGTAHFGKEKCAQVEALVLDGAEGWSVHEFARRVRRAVARVHPRDFSERHRRAAADADVSTQADEDSMAWLTARMPLVDALIVQKAVDAYAMSCKRRGDPRPFGVLRAEGLRVMAEGYLSGQLTGTRPTHHGRPVELQLVATPDTVLGLTNTPGEIPGVGPVPAETIRAMAGQAKLRWLTIDRNSGRLLDYNPKTYRAPASVAAQVKATWVRSVGPHSTVLADRCDLDHGQSFATGGLTEPDNLTPLDRGWHVPRTHGGFLANRKPDGTIEWLTPLGQTITIHPYDYRLCESDP